MKLLPAAPLEFSTDVRALQEQLYAKEKRVEELEAALHGVREQIIRVMDLDEWSTAQNAVDEIDAILAHALPPKLHAVEKQNAAFRGLLATFVQVMDSAVHLPEIARAALQDARLLLKDPSALEERIRRLEEIAEIAVGMLEQHQTEQHQRAKRMSRLRKVVDQWLSTVR